MYCPKCRDTFEEGSRRFCPTDGARLISESNEAGANDWQEGIFSNLIPKQEPKADRDESIADIPRFVVNEPPARAAAPVKTDDLGSDFFVLDDGDPEPAFDSIFAKPASAADQRPARKVDPRDIPAGHVELGNGDRLAVSSAEFQEDDPEAFIGRTVKGRYAVTELLGGEEGSYAFLADDKLVPDKKVLVRIILDDDNDEILGSILDEERVSLSHVTHPNIARIIDSGQFTDGPKYLISEYIDALSVADILSIHGFMDVGRASRIIRQVASALTEVHQEGILHRDLRPSNIIVMPGDGEAEQVTLVNFGASSGEATAYNRAYKAPEVLDGRVSTIASDIYSLAVVAFEMLTGQMPFSGNSAREIMRSQHEGLYLLPTQIRPELPHAIDIVFQKALSFDVSRRYPKARDLGDAFASALASTAPPVPEKAPAIVSPPRTATKEQPVDVKPVAATETAAPAARPVREEVIAPAVRSEEPAWTRRSPEPPAVGDSSKKWFFAVGIAALLLLLGIGWYYMVSHPVTPELAVSDGTTVPAGNTQPGASPVLNDTEMPPLPRTIPQPPNTNFYQNSKQNLRGDLLRNFVGFTLYYPKDWKVNGPQESATANARGKFLDISSTTPEGKLKEQMLISYYPSKGTFRDDAEKFPQLVKETNETLKKLLPGYQMVSEGEIKINGDWRAYEVKFQAGGDSPTGEKIVVWGRRLYIPAARPGVRDGFEITMLATSAADSVQSVDDVGVHGELAGILYSFEPSQNF